ncbi:prepilin-type N-terminal cleavage/methylation domain-containing protein [Acaryochloris sp. IP29b_bin.137]|uniref:prepilin-type N-terminal cleavage/methylation domain-containing protein n=1 Tax=Acaryochloris sp. IP29b_bin.137 TaxID=2969217 RepID=UPI00260BA505|nr:prepilin-type N-terminal cleavage/methylation domain-containing protein [Acaryochloris sp. IP29b_bin.137]
MFRLHPFVKLGSSPSEAGFTLAEKMVIVAIIGIAAAASAPSILASMNRAKVKQTMAEVRAALNETQREAIKGNKVCTLTLNFVDGKITGPCLKTGDRTLETDVEIATNLTDPNSNTARTNEGQPVLIGSDVQPSLGLSDGETISQIAMAPVPQEQAKASKAGVVVQIIAKCKGNTESGLGLGTCKDKDDDDDDSENGGHDSPSSPGPSASIPIKYGVLGNPEFAIVSAQQTPADPSGKIVFYSPNDSKATKRCIAISNTLGLTRIGTYQGDMSPTAITDSGRCTAENWEEQ